MATPMEITISYTRSEDYYEGREASTSDGMVNLNNELERAQVKELIFEQKSPLTSHRS